ncbi:MAG: hypothetical protein AB1346_05320 [Thermodesulfobacteriota bacterium]
MRRDDWKYDEDSWEEVQEGERVQPPAEKQCRNCLHWIGTEALYCSWCGKAQEEEKKKR